MVGALSKQKQAQRDAVVARRSAWVLIAAAAVMGVFQLFGLAFNLTMALILQIPQRVEPGPGITQVDLWAGILPYPVPAWIGALCIVAMAAVLVICWRPSRHLRPMPQAKFILQSSPGFIAFLALVTALSAVSCALFYQDLDGSFSWWWAAAAAGAVLTAVALARFLYAAPHRISARAREARRDRAAARAAERAAAG